MAHGTASFSKELLADGRIICYRFFSTDNAAANAWLQDVLEEFQNSNGMTRLLIDLSHGNDIIGAQLLLNIRDIGNSFPDIKGAMALIISNRIATQSVMMMLQRGIVHDYRRRSIFTNERAAVVWLLGTSDLIGDFSR